jgi:general secretion pathway protein G
MKLNARIAKLRIQRGARGFTFMELLIVMTIMAILVVVAVPIYMSYVKRARENVLRQDLWVMRQAIDKYTTDKEKAPQGLDDLVSAGYMREVPVDPITKEKDWVTEPEKSPANPEAPGIENVKSAAEGTDTNGTPYSDY